MVGYSSGAGPGSEKHSGAFWIRFGEFLFIKLKLYWNHSFISINTFTKSSNDMSASFEESNLANIGSEEDLALKKVSAMKHD